MIRIGYEIIPELNEILMVFEISFIKSYRAIPNCRLGDDKFWLRDIVLQLFTQVCDVDAKILRLFHGFRPPYFRKQLTVRQNFSSVDNQQS